MAIGDYLTTKDVARKLRVNTSRVSQLIADERFRLKVAARVGTTMFFTKEEVERVAKIPRKIGRPKKNPESGHRRRKSA